MTEPYTIPDYFRTSPDTTVETAAADWSALLSDYASWSAVVGVIVALVLLGIWLIARRMPVSIRNVSLKWGFTLVWCYGFLIYDIGMCTGEYISLFTNAPLALIYAFKIFLFEGNVSEIREVFHDSLVYSFNFALVHFLAAVISTLFLIKHFGFNVIAKLRVWWAGVRPWRKSVNDTYIFHGLNEASYRMIESIKEHYREEPEGYRIVVVRTNAAVDDSSESLTGIAKIFNFLAIPTVEMERLEQTGCLITGKFSNLRRIIEKRTSDNLHILFLSEDEKENLHDVSEFLNNTIMRKVTSSCKSKTLTVTLYCRARYNSIHRVIEDRNPGEGIKVKVIDAAHISVEMLKERADLLPVNYVDIRPDATVSSPFSGMVVGFSDTGQDITRFLYEFGAFVKSGSTPDHADRSTFHLSITDRHMRDIAGPFVINAKGVDISIPYLTGHRNPEALITLEEMDCGSVEFYRSLEEQIRTLNYVVVCTGDDELNITLAVRVLKTAIRLRETMDKFCILVRASRDNDGHIRQIARHYNRLISSRTDRDPIHIFGLDRDTFTYDNIIADRLERKAREYKERYERSLRGDTLQTESAMANKPFKPKDQPNLGTDYYPTYEELMKSQRTLRQDFSNSQHEATKRILAQTALQECGLAGLPIQGLRRKPGTTQYSGESDTKAMKDAARIAITIAQTEHLRWMASHQLMGYVYSDLKDELRLTHPCLTDWKHLSESVRSYDCNVSDLILGVTLLQ